MNIDHFNFTAIFRLLAKLKQKSTERHLHALKRRSRKFTELAWLALQCKSALDHDYTSSPMVLGLYCDCLWGLLASIVSLIER